MKLFTLQGFFKIKYSFFISVGLFITLQGCATMGPNYGKEVVAVVETEAVDSLELLHTFLLVGDAGNADEEKSKQMLTLFKKRVDGAAENSTLLFLGDNIYPRGMPEVESSNRDLAEEKLNNQIDLTKEFLGKTVFINGNHDWYNGYEGVKRQVDYLFEKTGDKKIVLPRKICAIERLKINEDVVLIAIDSEWFLQSWNKHPNINEDCEIKTREDFFDELRSLINKNQNKIVVIAMHHPVYSNGSHGGYFSLRKHLYPYKNIPAPVLGSLVNYLQKVSGGSPQDIQNKRYSELAQRVRTLVQGYENIVIVSGHEHNQQYLEKEGVKQIISGAGSKEDEARAIQPISFSSADLGYAILDVFKEGRARVRFYSAREGKEEMLFSRDIIKPKLELDMRYEAPKEGVVKASVYPKEWTEKSGFYRFLWGEHYRAYYGLPIEAEVADLTVVNGGLRPTISGGGNQSLSLRLQDKSGTEFVMRGVQKSASRFIQAEVFKDQYVEKSFEGTFAERFIYDFYTTSHPFTPFIIGDLASKVGVFHTNPKLWYVPKQPALGRFNEAYGDALYMIEERPSDGHEEEQSFGNAAVIISTDDVISNLRKDEKYRVDEEEYLKARLFDMIIGDWDRHADQWRWAEFKKGDDVVYKPIPRDRDQAFAKVDGAFLSLLKKLPPMRHIQSFKSKFADPRWINKTAFPLDQLFLKTRTEADWIAMARVLTQELTDESIELAFSKLPKEVQDEEMENILAILKERRNGIIDYASVYYRELSKYVVLAGTDKKDRFSITRLDNGSVEVVYDRMKKSGKEFQFSKVYSPDTTREIWIYGLNDQDEFIVNGAGRSKIKLRLIGGKNHDSFDVVNTRNTIVYDYKGKNTSFLNEGDKVSKIISNRYDLNNYDYRNLPITVATLLPNVGYNPEDGVKLGFNYSITRSKFIQDPFSSKHTIKGNYSFETKGLDIAYKGYFAQAKNNWMFTLGTAATSPNFSQNFYGFGNETHYFDEAMGDDYKRVRIESYSIEPGYRYEGALGGRFEVSGILENLKTKKIAERFIAVDGVVDERVFKAQSYAGAQLVYDYNRANSISNPTLGFGFHFKGGWKSNLEKRELNHGFMDVGLNFSFPMDRNENFVWASDFKYKTRFGNQFDFYHAAHLGGNSELRGFRPERFTGKTAFVHRSDIRWNIGAIQEGLVPMNYGAYVGFDYGRVWNPEEQSDKWHNSYGAGMWLNAIESMTIQASYFMSEDGGRFVFGLGFGF